MSASITVGDLANELHVTNHDIVALVDQLLQDSPDDVLDIDAQPQTVPAEETLLTPQAADIIRDQIKGL